MKFLFISISGDSLSVAQRIKEEGYEVAFANQDPNKKAIGEGLIPKVEDFHEVLLKEKKEDLIIIFDQVGFGSTADYLRSQGYKVFGAGKIADRLEEEREFGTQILKQIMKVPPTMKFEDWQAAKDWLEEIRRKGGDQQRFVFKPSGIISTGKTYVAKDIPDLLDEMEYYEKIWEQQEGEELNFEIQNFIEGVETSFAGYFNGKEFQPGAYTVTFEEKKFMNKGKGSTVGCAGNIVWFLSGKEQYFQKVLNKLAPLLAKYNYIGQIDINNIIAKKDGQAYGLEFTPRWGYDSLQAETELLKSQGKSLAKWITYMATGNKLPEDFFPTYQPAIAVRLTIPPYPEGDPKQTMGERINYPAELSEHIHLGDVKIDEKTGKLVAAGCDGVIMVVTATGKSIKECQQKVYQEYIPKIKIPDVQFRTDIGDQVAEELPQTKQWFKKV